MSEIPNTAEEAAVQSPDPTDDSTHPQEQELTLEQLDEHITRAEAAHKDLSARLDSIPRD